MKKWISLLMAALLVLPLNGNWFVRAAEAVPAVVYGDLTGDGQVSSEDALVALQCATAGRTAQDHQRQAGDVDGNGQLDLIDALLILQKAAGKIAAFPVESPAVPSALVIYFSCTGHTKAVAEAIAAQAGADLYEIVPANPYTSADLNYNDSNCRANREMNDPSARPAIGSVPVDLSAYDTVFIGYPIWWGTMPRIINTFLDNYDLSGKVVMPFCTSGSSGIGTSVAAIKAAEPDAIVRDGLRASGATDSRLAAWVAGA
mgnify:FL=1